MATSSTKQALVDTLGSGRVEYESNRGVSAGQVDLPHRPLESFQNPTPLFDTMPLLSPCFYLPQGITSTEI